MERVGELIVDKYWNRLDVREEFDTQWNASECIKAISVYMRHVEAILKEVLTRGPSAGITFQRRFTSILWDKVKAYVIVNGHLYTPMYIPGDGGPTEQEI